MYLMVSELLVAKMLDCAGHTFYPIFFAVYFYHVDMFDEALMLCLDEDKIVTT